MSKRKVIPDEVTGVSKSQTIESLVGCGKEFTFYSKRHGKPWEGFKQGSDMTDSRL